MFIIGANDFDAPPVDRSRRRVRSTRRGAPSTQQLVDARCSTRSSSVGRGAGQRPVYWVGAPTDGGPEARTPACSEVNAVARDVVARHPEATYVDAYELFSGEDGEYTATLPGPNGEATCACAPATASTSRPKAATCSPAHVYDAARRALRRRRPGRARRGQAGRSQTKGSREVPARTGERDAPSAGPRRRRRRRPRRTDPDHEPARRPPATTPPTHRRPRHRRRRRRPRRPTPTTHRRRRRARTASPGVGRR